MNTIKNFFSLLKFKNYNKNKERINTENRTGITLILVFYAVILVLNVISSLLSRQSILQNRNLVLELIYMIIMVPLYFSTLVKKNINFTLLIYLVEIPMLLITIWHGTFGDPTNITVTFLLFIIILPELILDKPSRVILFVIAITVIYMLADYFAKTPYIFVKDLLHSFNSCMMSIAVSLYVLAVRIQNTTYINIVQDKADKDSLTGLYNRYGADRHFKKNTPGLLMYMDLDQFKEVNDEFGHGEGDLILQKTADTLKDSFRKNDILIRMGGDEFAVFAFGNWTREQITKKLTELLEKIDHIHSSADAQNKKIFMTVSIGCVYAPYGADNLDELIRCADHTMYEVKRSGKNDYKIVLFGNTSNSEMI